MSQLWVFEVLDKVEEDVVWTIEQTLIISESLRSGSTEKCWGALECVLEEARHGSDIPDDVVSGVLCAMKRPDAIPQVKILAMTALETLSPRKLRENLPELLASSDPSVRRIAEQVLERLMVALV